MNDVLLGTGTIRRNYKIRIMDPDLRQHNWICNNDQYWPEHNYANYLRIHLFFRGFRQLPQFPQASLVQKGQPSSLHTLPRLLFSPGLAGTGSVTGNNISMALCSCCCSKLRVGCWPCSAKMAAIKFCIFDGRTGCC